MGNIPNPIEVKLNKTGASPYELGVGAKVCAPGVLEEYPKGSGELELVYKTGDEVEVEMIRANLESAGLEVNVLSQKDHNTAG